MSWSNLAQTLLWLGDPEHRTQAVERIYSRIEFTLDERAMALELMQSDPSRTEIWGAVYYIRGCEVETELEGHLLRELKAQILNHYDWQRFDQALWYGQDVVAWLCLNREDRKRIRKASKIVLEPECLIDIGLNYGVLCDFDLYTEINFELQNALLSRSEFTPDEVAIAKDGIDLKTFWTVSTDTVYAHILRTSLDEQQLTEFLEAKSIGQPSFKRKFQSLNSRG